MADALVNVAETYLNRADTQSSSRPRTQLVVHVDQDPLSPDATLAATLDDGTRISAETLRRIACDTTLVAVRHNGGEESVGRRTRTISPNLRLALWMRDRGCRFPGCTNHLFLHAHHIHHWAHGGATSADNLVLLCSTHHRLVHEGGFSVKRLSDEVRFMDRRGAAVESVPAPFEVDGDGTDIIAAWNRKAGVDVDSATGFPQWDGDAIDYDWAVDALMVSVSP
jgi:hypothetical protein